MVRAKAIVMRGSWFWRGEKRGSSGETKEFDVPWGLVTRGKSESLMLLQRVR